MVDAAGFVSSMAADRGSTAHRRALAAAYFAGEARCERCSELAARFVAEAAPILPILPSDEALASFTKLVPASLHPVNGIGPDLDRAVNTLLADLGLLRRRRRLFISYLRRESTGVARQLAADLLSRGFEVFLDTMSVDKGVLFQDALWEAMVDTDIVVFLDSPSVMDSRWVTEEFLRATELGITLLHLLWPGRPHDRAQAFAEPIVFKNGDFLGNISDSAAPQATLGEPVVERIAGAIERLRAAAWRHRRARLTETLIRQVASGDEREEQGKRLTLQAIDAPTGAIHLTRHAPAGGEPAKIVVLPLHGLPRSLDWEDAATAYGDGDGDGDVVERRLLFQRSGIGARQRAHIAWLDRHLPTTQSLAVEEIEAWLQTQE